MAVQESLGFIPQVGALFAQSKNLIHSDILHFIISKAPDAFPGLPLSLGCRVRVRVRGQWVQAPARSGRVRSRRFGGVQTQTP